LFRWELVRASHERVVRPVGWAVVCKCAPAGGHTAERFSQVWRVREGRAGGLPTSAPAPPHSSGAHSCPPTPAALSHRLLPPRGCRGVPPAVPGEGRALWPRPVRRQGLQRPHPLRERMLCRAAHALLCMLCCAALRALAARCALRIPLPLGWHYASVATACPLLSCAVWLRPQLESILFRKHTCKASTALPTTDLRLQSRRHCLPTSRPRTPDHPVLGCGVTHACPCTSATRGPCFCLPLAPRWLHCRACSAASTGAITQPFVSAWLAL
jgi:hypothetical protein